MNQFKTITTTMGLLALLATASVQADSGGPLRRFAADFFKFDGGEFFTTLTAVSGPDISTPGAPDGALFYEKNVKVNASINTLYVSIDTTGDAHEGAALWLSCRVNGAFCRPSTVPAVDGAPSGWINLLKVPQDVTFPSASNNCDDGGGGTADCHDNNINYTWCIPVNVPADLTEQTVNIKLKMASSTGGVVPFAFVFIEKGHVFIDGSKIQGDNRCTEIGLPDPNGDALADESFPFVF